VTDAGRPQDQGRRHRAKGQPSAETASLLAEYQAAMRDELRACLVELKGSVAPTGLLDSEFTVSEVRTRPPLKDRAALWDLAIKVGRELGTAVDAGPAKGSPAEAPAPRKWRRSRVDYGPDR
jgi:hypothetical protein